MRKVIRSILAKPSFADSHSVKTLAYNELEGPRDIRLLRVQSSEFERIVLEVLHVSLDSLPGLYTAISYRWDDSVSKHTIRCGKERLCVNETLYSILKKVTEDGQSLVWIDALCINQSNAEEKSQQVRMMWDIYNNATEVLIWLGAPKLDGELAIDTIQKLESFFRQVNANDLAAIERLGQYHIMNTLRPLASWQNIGKLLLREWFQRVWIIQEVVAGSKVSLICDRYKLPWETFAFVMTEIEQRGLHDLVKQENTVPPGLVNSVLIQELRDIRHQNKALSLQILLIITLEFKASDWRDKVFALIGLASGQGHEEVTADYTKPLEDVYISTAKYLLNHNADLLIMSAAGIGRPRSSLKLPSWVPDWSLDFKASNLSYVSLKSGYSATKGSSPHFINMPEPRILVLRGLMIDMVNHCASAHPLPLQGREEHNSELITKSCKEALHGLLEGQRLAFTLSPYPTGESCQDVYWRTLIANMSVTGEPSSASHGEGFLAWLNLLHFRAQWPTPHVQPSMQDVQQADSFRVAFSKHGRGRTFFITHRGYMGLGPPGMHAGDHIGLILGACTPYVLRESVDNLAEEGTYALVGECYLHGLMYGEGMSMGEIQNIRLI